jgi:hypothetical protein
LKPETRILLAHCSKAHNICIGVILRGSAVDGVVSGRDCENLCKSFFEAGYAGETRFSYGECRCNLESPPASNPLWALFLSALSTGDEWLAYYEDP